VGSYPEGAGRWGHLDLAGNVAEWVFDAHDVDDAEQWYSMPCIDCARADDWRVRVIKGGHFDSAERALRPASRSIMDREYWNHDRGVRCAHSDKR
jgi:formylglycine-generating enzyme required for sulfatase activity